MENFVRENLSDREIKKLQNKIFYLRSSYRNEWVKNDRHSERLVIKSLTAHLLQSNKDVYHRYRAMMARQFFPTIASKLNF